MRNHRLIMLLPALVATAALAVYAQEAEKQLQAAIHKETVDGDLRGAINAYRKVIASAAGSSNRQVAAQAQLRLGLCYEKLGGADAMRVYQELVARYPDQKDSVTQAQARLAALSAGGPAGTQAAGVSVRLLWDNALLLGRMSADGRYMSYVDWESGGNPAIRDFRTGTNRVVVRTGDWPESNQDTTYTALSNDGKQIAYLFRQNREAGRGRRYDIRAANADGSNDRLLYKGQVNEYMEPVAWLVDNKRLAVMTWGDKKSVKSGILFVDTVTGKASLRLETPDAWPVFSPDGKWYAFHSEKENQIFIGEVEGTEPPRGFAAHPAGDRVVGWSPDGGYLLLASKRESTLGFWLQPVASGRLQGEARLVKDNLPERVRQLGFLSSGAYSYGTDEFRTRTLAASIDLAAMRLDGPLAPFRPERGASYGAAWSPDGKRMFYRIRERFVIRDLGTGSEYDLIPRLKNMGHDAQWAPGGDAIVVVGEDHAEQRGYYQVDVRTGEARQIAGSNAHPARARFSMPRDGQTIYYLAGSSVNVKNLATGEDRVAYRFPEAGAAKIAVSADGRWLAVHQERKIRIVDTQSGEVRRTIPLAKPTDDLGKMVWLADGAALLAEIWSGGWAARTSMVKIPVAEGSAWTSLDLGTGSNGFSLSPDGKRLLVTDLKQVAQVWLMENFLPRK